MRCRRSSSSRFHFTELLRPTHRHHTRGTRRYLTRPMYSVYPTSSRDNSFSSSSKRHIKTGINGTSSTSVHHDPSASGIPTNSQMAEAYICLLYTSDAADERSSVD